MRTRSGRFVLGGGLWLLVAVAVWAAPAGLPDPVDIYGDPLPPEAIARMGTVRFRHVSHVECLAYSPDGKMLASGGYDGSVWLWEAATGRLLRKLEGMEAYVYSLAFSPDGDALATASVPFNPPAEIETVRIDFFAMRDGKRLDHLEVPSRAVLTVGYAAGGKTLLAARCDAAEVVLCEAATGKVLRRLSGHKGPVLSAAFSGDGKTVVTLGQDQTFRRWDARNGEELRKVAPTLPQTIDAGAPYSFTFSPDGRTLAVGYRGLFLFDAATGDQLREFKQDALPIALAFSPDGNALAAGFMHSLPIRVWNLATGEEARPPRGHTRFINAVALSPDGKVLVTAGGDETVRLWVAATGKEVAKVEEQGRLSSLAFSPDGRTLAWGRTGQDGGVRLSSAATGEELRRIGTATLGVSCVTFSPDGNTLAAGTGDKAIYLWDSASGKERLHFAAHPNAVTWLAFSPDGKTLASMGDHDDAVRLWEAATGKEIRRFPVEGNVYSAAFSADGTAVAAATVDGSIRLWDAGTGRLIRRVKCPNDLQPSAPCLLEMIAFTPDGRSLIAVGPLGKQRLYETATGACRQENSGHLGGAYQIAVSADGRLLATAGYDCTALLWDLAGSATAADHRPSPAELDALCSDLAGSDARKAYQAIRSLAAAGSPAVSLLRERLRPADSEEANRLAKRIDDLDSDDFEVRESASAELARIGEAAVAALQKAAKDSPSPEVRRRAEAVLGKLPDSPLTGERLRGVRAVEVLERMNIADARGLLEALSRGAPEARLTRDAKAALDRVGRRQAAP